MMKKVWSLTKIFTRDFYQKLNIIDKETRKINKKSVFFWLLIIMFIAVVYISYKLIQFLIKMEQPEIFLNMYSTFIMLLLLFQTAIISTNIFFFSKDLEFILPLPVSSLELSMAKFSTMIIMLYVTEIIFGLLPFLLYGLLNFTSFSYFLWLFLVLVLMPVIISVTIATITILFMKIFTFIKRKNLLQNLISTILLIFVLGIEYFLLKSDFLKEPSIILKPVIMLLSKIDANVKFYNLLLICIVTVISLVISLVICKKIYLKTILKLSQSKEKKISKKNIKIENKNISKAYIIKELKTLYRQPVFFMQTILPIIISLITIIMIGTFFIPVINSMVNTDEQIQNTLSLLPINSEIIMLILGILQCLFSISKLSLTAISREGKNAQFMKYIPISFYRQFVYKNVLQVSINIIVSIITLGMVYYIFPKIGIINIILIFIISIFINLINSYLMLLVDVRRPSLNWNSEYTVVKKNDNKFFQYVLTIGLILIFIYLSTIFKEIDVVYLLIVEMLLFMSIFIILDRNIKKKSNKIFNKII